MKKMLFGILVSLCIMTTIISCDSNYSKCVYQPDLADAEVTIPIERLDKELLNIQSADELRAFMKDNPVITTYFLNPSAYPNDSVMVSALLRKFQNPYIDTLEMEIDRVFGDASGLQADFEEAFSHLKYYYPEVKIPEVKTIATGFDYDLYISDSLIVVGLDYYLGKGARFRPKGMFDYMLQRYTPNHIVPSIMLLKGISPEFNKTDLSDKAILSDMITYGKSYYFAKHMMPCIPDSTLIWYSTEELEGVRENQDIVWAHFIENEILFETDHMIKKKYIDDRPKTYEIGEKAPGRIGTWLGWEIVKKYMNEHPDKTLPELMSEKSARKLFNQSKYKPNK